MKKRVLTVVLAGVLSASMVVPAFASSSASEGGAIPTPRGTEVLAGIMLKDPDAKIKVEVPTLFAFVVNGSVDSDNKKAVTSTNGGIMLPNVKVNVIQESAKLGEGTDAGEAIFAIETVEDTVMQFTNYSTVKNEKHTSTSEADIAPREGLKVKINGSIKNDGDAESRNHWEHVANAGAATMQGETIGFKKYTISVNGEAFNVGEDGGFVMAKAIELGAPDLEWAWDKNANSGAGAYAYKNMNTTTMFAESGITKDAKFDVAVGGQQGQYRQVEQSAKVGTIVWTISVQVTTNDTYTAPNNDYLDGVLGGDTDPDGELNP